MAEEFKVIETQEQLDAVISERLNRQKKQHETELSTLKGTLSTLQGQYDSLSKAHKDAADKYAGYDKTLEEAQAKIKAYETSSVKMRIAHETGIPYELAGRLSGDTEEAIRKDAEAITKIIGKQTTPAPPLKDTEPGTGDTKTAALKALAKNLTNKGD